MAKYYSKTFLGKIIDLMNFRKGSYDELNSYEKVVFILAIMVIGGCLGYFLTFLL